MVWLVPFTAFFTLLTAIGKKGVLFTSQLAGAIPFLALIYFRLKLGDRFFLALQVGTYIILVLGAMLFVLPRFLKKPEPKT
ncbi:MAG: hypothetical protein JWR19_4098 [Pedosphaera sp.]|nr:hypothetical protein [Pedosphaera sp.]